MKRQTTRSSYYEFWIMLRSLQDLSKRLYKIINRTWHLLICPTLSQYNITVLVIVKYSFNQMRFSVHLQTSKSKMTETRLERLARTLSIENVFIIYILYTGKCSPPPPFIFVPFALVVRMGEFNTANNISLIHLHLGEKKTGRNRLQL